MGYMYWSMDRIANIVKAWQDNKFDGLIVIDGNRGLGKSTFAIKLGYKVGNFKLKKDLVFSREDVMNHLAKKTRGIIISDEAINVTYNRDFYNEAQKKMLKMVNMYRDRCNILIMCIPNFYDLDKQMRNLTKMRIHVIRRGYAVIHQRRQSSYSSDRWDMAVNEKMERKWLEKRLFKPNYKKLTTYFGMVRYGALPERIENVYTKLKDKKRNVIAMEGVDGEDAKKKNMFDVLVERIQERKITKEMLIQIAAINNMKYSTINDKINRKLRDKEVGKTLNYFLTSSLESSPNLTTNHSRSNRKVYKEPVIKQN